MIPAAARHMRATVAVCLTIVVVMALAGCAATPTGVDARVAVPRSWSLEGRLALSNGRDGGSGQLIWNHEPAVEDLRFHGALGRGSWRLTAIPHHAVLALGDGRTFAAADVESLVAEHTGWVIPVDSLGHWVVGQPDPEVEAQQRRDAEGRLELLIQRGWTIQYEGYYAVDGRWLPRKITADRNGDRVRLLVKAWDAGAAGRAAAGTASD